METQQEVARKALDTLDSLRSIVANLCGIGQQVADIKQALDDRSEGFNPRAAVEEQRLIDYNGFRVRVMNLADGIEKQCEELKNKI